MKLVIELNITGGIMDDYDDISERMQWLMRHFDYCWRNDIDMTVGVEGVIPDRDDNPVGKWELAP